MRTKRGALKEDDIMPQTGLYHLTDMFHNSSFHTAIPEFKILCGDSMAGDPML